jgi:hypothetical protein
MAKIKFGVAHVGSFADIPSPPKAGFIYVFKQNDAEIMYLARSDGSLLPMGPDIGIPPGGLPGQVLAKVSAADGDVAWTPLPDDVIDSLTGDWTDAAPSVRAVNEALEAKADLVGGFVPITQLPDANRLYRGAFTSAADLEAAHPTDEPGAYATVITSGDSSLYIWNDTDQEWQDSGGAGPFVESVNGNIGPAVVILLQELLNNFYAVAGFTEPVVTMWDPVEQEAYGIPLSRFILRVDLLSGGSPDMGIGQYDGSVLGGTPGMYENNYAGTLIGGDPGSL